MLRFLHLADLHLGLRITRFDDGTVDRIREARFRALERVRSEAARDYAFVIVAGDLFDDVHVSRSIANRAFNLLSSFPVPVLVISGNHDPIEPGSLWEMPPWSDETSETVRFLSQRKPYRELPGATIFPCPVYRKRSAENPTKWIADSARQDGDGVRIGIAHGSVMDRPDLPDDDHPIAPTAATDLDLDYLALGHWHRKKIYTDAANAARMAYPGVHEPMRFRDDTQVSGWKPYSAGQGREEFLDEGDGLALSVSIDQPGAAPVVEPISVRHLQWISRRETIRSEADFDALLQRVAETPQAELTLLRIMLEGTLPIQVMQRLDELREVLGRFVFGELAEAGLNVEPTENEIREMIGSGVLAQVHQRLQSLAEQNGHATTEPVPPAVLEQTMRLLYRLAARVGDG